VNRTRLVLAAAVLALAVAAVPALGATPKLTGTDGPGFTITLKKGSTKVTKVKAGKYTITVNDLSSSHNFHLTGPGLNKKTEVSFQGKKTWTVTLKKGKTYKYVCDPHASFMKGSFKVT